MQIYADVCNRPMKVSRSARPAPGGGYFRRRCRRRLRTLQQAQQKMTGTGPAVYRPNKAAAVVYAELYKLYRTLHDAFGTTSFYASMACVMKDLIALRDRTRRS